MSASQRREDTAPRKTRPLWVVGEDKRADPPRPDPPPPERTSLTKLVRQYPDLAWLGIWGPLGVLALMLGIGKLLVAVLGLVATLALTGALIVVCVVVFVGTSRERGDRS